MSFHHVLARGNLDISNNPLPVFPQSNDPRDSLRKNTIKPRKDFSAFKKPIINTPDPNVRAINMFQVGMIQSVMSAANNCSSCGGAK